MIQYVVAAALLGCIAAGAGGWWKGYQTGRESREAEVIELRSEAAKAEAVAVAAKEAAIAAGKRASQRVVERIRVVEAEAQQTPQIIERVVRESDCRLPPAFRLLWDGPDQNGDYPAGSTDVPIEALAQAAAEARKRFAENQARLDSLQQYVQEISNRNHQ